MLSCVVTKFLRGWARLLPGCKQECAHGCSQADTDR